MTTSPQEPPTAESAKGYVLRGGPLDGAAARERRPAFVHLEHYNGDGDVYRPSGHPDGERPELERYDFEEMGTDQGRRHHGRSEGSG
ncbi:hypothetical protein KDL01_09080 [Actinospica durhamensis]|uniref:Uncharacterized protein n=1 Tax=Actinospica durhamensis TaxID=1508375 RepID=A0A941EKS3_9ACTN|nr:hypothetical protein [Actinospica durhamensis]MBR7833417.1 hypothetical protein [Actinospica durhamensis]